MNLLQVNSNDPRKSSSASLEKQSALLKILSANQHLSHEKILKSPGGSPELQDLLQTSFEWDFDIFKLETLSNKR